MINELCNPCQKKGNNVKRGETDVKSFSSGALRHGSQRSLKYLICIFENQIIPCFTIFRIMYLFKTL